MSLDADHLTMDDVGRRVSYRWKKGDPARQLGVISRLCRRPKYGPGVMVLYDGREKPQFVYLRNLQWETPECRWEYALGASMRSIAIEEGKDLYGQVE